MNTARCTRKRPRSIQKLTADLDDIAGDFALIDHSIKLQQARHVDPRLITPQFDGEAIHQLHNALWVLVTFGLRLEEVAKERARWRSLTVEQRRELNADRNRHADQPTRSTVINVAPSDPSGAPHQDVHTSAATR